MSHYGRQLVPAVARAAWYAALCVLGSTGLSSVGRAQTTQCAITLAWDANTEADLASYKLSWGQLSRNYTASLGITKDVTLQQLTLPLGKTYYFTVQAVNSAGVVSGFSNEVKVDLTTCPTSGTVYRVPLPLRGVVSAIVIRGS